MLLAIRFLHLEEGVIGFNFVCAQKATPAFQLSRLSFTGRLVRTGAAEGPQSGLLPRVRVVLSTLLLDCPEEVDPCFVIG